MNPAAQSSVEKLFQGANQDDWILKGRTFPKRG